MSVRVIDLTPRIKAMNSIQTNLALRFMIDDIDKISTPRTPRRLGNLRRDKFKQVVAQKGTIIWNKEYAVYQEYKQYVNYTTPGTGPHFAENAVNKVVKDAEKYFKRAKLI